MDISEFDYKTLKEKHTAMPAAGKKKILPDELFSFVTAQLYMPYNNSCMTIINQDLQIHSSVKNKHTPNSAGKEHGNIYWYYFSEAGMIQRLLPKGRWVMPLDSQEKIWAGL